MELDAAERLLEKIRRFVADDLDDEERPLYAALLAPGVARAYAEAEVTGFEVIDWVPATLPEALAEAIRRGNIRIEGLDE